jgi:hypothetical protein
MHKLVAATVAALALAPSVAAAAPTASQITTPANPTFATIDPELPQSLQITGATSGGEGDVDIRC